MMGKRQPLPMAGKKELNLSVKLGEDHLHALEIIGNRLAPGQPLDKSNATRHAIMETARIDPAFVSVKLIKDERIEMALEGFSKLTSMLDQALAEIRMLHEKVDAKGSESSPTGTPLAQDCGPSQISAAKWQQALRENSKVMADWIRVNGAMLNLDAAKDIEVQLLEIVPFASLAFEQGVGSLSFQYFNSLFFEKEKVHLLVGSLADYRNQGTFKKFPHKLGFLALKIDLGQLSLKTGATYRFCLRDYSRATQIYEVIQDPNPKCNEPSITLRSVGLFPLVA